MQDRIYKHTFKIYSHIWYGRYWDYLLRQLRERWEAGKFTVMVLYDPTYCAVSVNDKS